MPFVEKWIHKFQIKSGTWVFVPSEESVNYGYYVKEMVETYWSPPRNYFHLMDGGHVKALRSHINNSFFARLDIEDFFGCINKSRVTRCLKDYLPYETARKIAVASTVLHPVNQTTKYTLPFGFVQSPIIASMCLHKSRLGKVLHEVHNSTDHLVSVYMDDIIISGNDRDHMLGYLQDIKDAAVRSRFFLNHTKEEGPSEKITAFNIELSNRQLEITQNRMELFESAYLQAAGNDQREGIIGYISSVNKGQAEKLHHQASH